MDTTINVVEDVVSFIHILKDNSDVEKKPIGLDWIRCGVKRSAPIIENDKRRRRSTEIRL